MGRIICIFLVCSFCILVKAQVTSVIGKPVKIGKLIVAQYDFPDMLDYKEAEKLCSSLGRGWRLPYRKEMEILYKNRNRIGNFTGGHYWIGEDYANGPNGEGYYSCWTFVFESNQESHSGMNRPNCVRAVKSL